MHLKILVLTTSIEYILSTKCSNVPLYIYIETCIIVYVQFIFSVLSRNCSHICYLVFYLLFLLLTVKWGDNEQLSMFFVSKIENQTQVSKYPWTCWEKLTFDQSFLSKHQIYCLKIFVSIKKGG